MVVNQDLARRNYKPRNLPDKSYLRFIFPTSTDYSQRVIVTLPFFENIEIEESQRARYSKYDLLSRPGNMYTYTGADSRQIRLAFSMTIPHINISEKGPLGQYIRYGANGENTREKIKHEMRTYLKSEGEKNPNSLEQLAETISLVQWWTNLIRVSVANNTEDPRQGPPILSLRHGPLYKDAKFINQNYKISYDSDAGYDVDSLMPRRVNVVLQLSEIKAGDFTDYIPGDVPKSDNVTGWQDLFKWGTIDPDDSYKFKENG